MCEEGQRRRVFPTEFLAGGEKCFETDEPKYDDNPRFPKVLQFLNKVRPTVFEFFWRRFVIGWCAVDSGGDVAVD